jgi:UDP-N-acetylmuramoylalanine--D-glutamate ligase
MAYGAATALDIADDVIAAAMRSFPGLAHRMQQVGVVNGVPFINDSKATNADAAEKALASFDNIHWIAGGISKAGGIEPLAPYFSKIRKAYLIGAAAESFAKTLSGKVDYVMADTLERAVQVAAQDAKKGAVVLLSPACASFDHYKNFEVRGDAFVELVSKLPGAVMAHGGNS